MHPLIVRPETTATRHGKAPVGPASANTCQPTVRSEIRKSLWNIETHGTIAIAVLGGQNDVERQSHELYFGERSSLLMNLASNTLVTQYAA